jgi:hypothetical protein
VRWRRSRQENETRRGNRFRNRNLGNGRFCTCPEPTQLREELYNPRTGVGSRSVERPQIATLPRWRPVHGGHRPPADPAGCVIDIEDFDITTGGALEDVAAALYGADDVCSQGRKEAFECRRTIKTDEKGRLRRRRRLRNHFGWRDSGDGDGYGRISSGGTQAKAKVTRAVLAE